MAQEFVAVLTAVFLPLFSKRFERGILVGKCVHVLFFVLLFVPPLSTTYLGGLLKPFGQCMGSSRESVV